MPTKKKSTPKKTTPPVKITRLLGHDDVPATVGLVNEVRAELLAEVRSVNFKLASVDGRLKSMDSRFDGIDSRLDGMDSRFDAMDSRFDAMDSRFDAMDSRFDAMESRLGARIDDLDGRIEKVFAVVHRTQALMEEQRGENRIVLDGIKSVMERQERVEEETKEFRETLKIFLRAKKEATI
jgi:hypothetical protein